MHENNNGIADELVRATPPIGVSTLTLLGCNLHDLVYIATLVYTAVQIVCTIYRTIKRKD